jgi:hypothetical protein
MERRALEDDCVCEVRVCGSPLYLRQKDFYECSSPDFTGCTEEEKEEAEAAPSSSSAGATTTTIITSMDKEKEEAPTTYVPSYSPPLPTPYEPTFQCLPLPINRVPSLKRHSSPIKPNYSPMLPRSRLPPSRSASPRPSYSMELHWSTSKRRTRWRRRTRVCCCRCSTSAAQRTERYEMLWTVERDEHRGRREAHGSIR